MFIKNGLIYYQRYFTTFRKWLLISLASQLHLNDLKRQTSLIDLRNTKNPQLSPMVLPRTPTVPYEVVAMENQY